MSPNTQHAIGIKSDRSAQAGLHAGKRGIEHPGITKFQQEQRKQIGGTYHSLNAHADAKQPLQAQIRRDNGRQALTVREELLSAQFRQMQRSAKLVPAGVDRSAAVPLNGAESSLPEMSFISQVPACMFQSALIVAEACRESISSDTSG